MNLHGIVEKGDLGASPAVGERRSGRRRLWGGSSGRCQPSGRGQARGSTGCRGEAELVVSRVFRGDAQLVAAPVLGMGSWVGSVGCCGEELEGYTKRRCSGDPNGGKGRRGRARRRGAATVGRQGVCGGGQHEGEDDAVVCGGWQQVKRMGGRRWTAKSSGSTSSLASRLVV